MRVLVVGGGVWGLLSALALARAGARVTVVEEHRRLGRPPHCTGLVSERVVGLIGWPARASVSEWFPFFRLCGGEWCVQVEPLGGVYRLDRVRLEELLGETAEAEGVDVRLGARVGGVEADGTAKLPWGVERFDLVVLAEGAVGGLRRRLGVGYLRRFVYGFNAVVDRERCGGLEPGFEVRFTERARGLFEWRVPVREGCLIGGGSGEPGVLGRLVPRGARRVYGGPLPLEGPARRLRAGRVVAVGDAAGLVKPLTGGGLYPAALYYSLLARAAGEGGVSARVVERAARAVAGVLARSLGAARVFRWRPRLAECVVRGITRAGLRVLRGVDYDLHHALPFRVARRAPGRAVAAGLRAVACDPRGAASALAGLLSGAVLPGTRA